MLCINTRLYWTNRPNGSYRRNRSNRPYWSHRCNGSYR